MRVERIRAAPDGGRVEAEVDGRTLRFATRDARLEPVPEAFASALLLPAAGRGEVLEIDAPVDPAWLARVPEILAVTGRWWGLGDTRVTAPVAAPSTGPGAEAVAQCFTGGVDSFYAVLEAPRPPDFLVYVHGYDIRLDDRRRLDAFLPGMRATAAAVGARAIVVETDLRTHPAMAGSDWEKVHGGALAAVGHLLSGVAGRLVIPSSYPYHDEHPWGSHWDLDPLWSSGRLVVEHSDATLRRDGKVRAMARHPLVREHLRVCWEERTPTGNCSRCEKCVRTMVTFAMCDALDGMAAFDLDDPLPRRVEGLGRLSRPVLPVWEDIRRGISDPALAAAADRLIARSRAPRSWWSRLRGSD